MVERADLLQKHLGAIIRLEVTLGDLASDPSAQQGLFPVLDARRQEFVQLLLAAPGPLARATFGPSVGAVNGETVNVATVQYIYQTIYGRDPTADERRRLEWYLRSIANSSASDIATQQVYIMVASSRTTPLFVGYRSETQGWLEFNGQALVPSQNRHPDWVLPDMAIVAQPLEVTEGKLEVTFHNAVTTVVPRPDDPAVLLSRSVLISEALAEPVPQGEGIVLLGEPGGGKSTFMRYLASAMAKRGLGESGRDTHLPGWEQGKVLVPVFLPVRYLATTLAARPGEDAVDVVFDAILQVLNRGIAGMGDVLNGAISNGGMLVMFDGLDEIPPADRGEVAGRRRVVQALRAFVQRYPNNLTIVTCRTKVFTDDLRRELGWREPVEVLAPFTLGQMRALAYALFAAQRGRLAPEQEEQYTQHLIDTIVENPKLLSLARTPMLLRMMAEIVLHGGVLPLDRPRLFETLIDRTLDGWEKTQQQTTLATDYRISKTILDSIRPIFNEQAYRAYDAGAGSRERARILRAVLLTELTDFFDAQVPPLPANPAKACLDYLEQRADLVVRDADDYYSFAHPTLQEYCVARYLAADQERATQLITRYRRRDYWREPILLCAGMLTPVGLNRVLEDLVSGQEGDQPKPTALWYRDLLLAADIAAERGWEYLQAQALVRASSLRSALSAGLARLLADAGVSVPPGDRIRAGYTLADLGDSRVPLDFAAWRRAVELRGQAFGHAADAGASHYLCRLPAGAYHDDAGQALLETPPFWIAAYPVTVAQYAPFVSIAYTPEGDKWWTPAGLQWRAEKPQPALWEDLLTGASNVPMIGATWFEAAAYCRWLTAQLADVIPVGYAFRLPFPAEWYIAAAFDGSERPRAYPWGDNDPTPDRAIYNATRITTCAAVGCFPAGAAACGAHDMAGNVWEWTEGADAAPEGGAAQHVQAAIVGGAWNSGPDDLRCRRRDMVAPDQSGINIGFRVVLAPAS